MFCCYRSGLSPQQRGFPVLVRDQSFDPSALGPLLFVCLTCSGSGFQPLSQGFPLLVKTFAEPGQSFPILIMGFPILVLGEDFQH